MKFLSISVGNRFNTSVFNPNDLSLNFFSLDESFKMIAKLHIQIRRTLAPANNIDEICRQRSIYCNTSSKKSSNGKSFTTTCGVWVFYADYNTRCTVIRHILWNSLFGGVPCHRAANRNRYSVYHFNGSLK